MSDLNEDLSEYLMRSMLATAVDDGLMGTTKANGVNNKQYWYFIPKQPPAEKKDGI
jgi:hypothetical protein